MLLRRVIPCLDVDKGRVVKGTNFVGLRDAGALPDQLRDHHGVEHRGLFRSGGLHNQEAPARRQITSAASRPDPR